MLMHYHFRGICLDMMIKLLWLQEHLLKDLQLNYLVMDL